MMKLITALAIGIIITAAFHTGCSSPVSTGPGEIVTVHIGFSIQSQSRVYVSIENSYQTRIRILVDEVLLPGNYRIRVDMTDEKGNPLPEGLYNLTISTNEYSDSHVLILTYN
jgi:hypothetical protein